MDYSEMERKIWYVWTLVAFISMFSLGMPVFEIRYSGIAYVSPEIYSGYRVLFGTGVPRFLSAEHIGRNSIELLTLKVLLCGQLLLDIMLILVWVSRCWHEKIERIFYITARRICVVLYPLILVEIQRCARRYVSSYKGGILGGRAFLTGGYGWSRCFHYVFIVGVMILSVLSLIVLVKCKACGDAKN